MKSIIKINYCFQNNYFDRVLRLDVLLPEFFFAFDDVLAVLAVLAVLSVLDVLDVLDVLGFDDFDDGCDNGSVLVRDTGVIFLVLATILLISAVFSFI